MTKDSKQPKAKTHKAPKKVFDVVRPGKSPAAPNSRSVIVGHKAHVQDDQFVPEHSSHWAGTDPSEKRPLMDSRKKIELNPNGESEDSERVIARESGKSGVKNDASRATVDASKEGQETMTIVDGSAPPLPAKSTKADEQAVARDAHMAEKITSSSPVALAESSVASDAEALVSKEISVTGAGDEPESVPSGVQSNSGRAETSDHLADLAIDQVIESENNNETDKGANTPAPDETAESIAILSAQSNVSERQSTKTADDLLAETNAPSLEHQKVIVSTHRHHTGVGAAFLIFFLIIFVAVVALNFLLDAGVIKTEAGIPYTDLIR